VSEQETTGQTCLEELHLMFILLLS